MKRQMYGRGKLDLLEARRGRSFIDGNALKLRQSPLFTPIDNRSLATEHSRASNALSS
jgi:hypothetical protein